MSASRYDAIIVGGGHNGLVTAAYLAMAGKKVLVCCGHGGDQSGLQVLGLLLCRESAAARDHP